MKKCTSFKVKFQTKLRHGKKKKKKLKGKPPRIEETPVQLHVEPTVESVYQAAPPDDYQNEPQAKTRSPKKKKPTTIDTTTSVPSFDSVPSAVSDHQPSIPSKTSTVPSKRQSSLDILLAKQVDPAVDQLQQGFTKVTLALF